MARVKPECAVMVEKDVHSSKGTQDVPGEDLGPVRKVLISMIGQ